MVSADLARAALVALLAVAHSSVGLVYVVAFGLATGSIVFNPAATALVPEVVDDDELVAANSALWTVAVAVQVVLAPAAGAVVAAVGVTVAFALNAASYVASAWMLRGLRAGRTHAGVAAAGWHALGEGVRTVRAHTLLGRLVVVQLLAALSAGATGGLLVVWATERAKVGPAGFGALLGAIGVGAVAGPLVLGRFIRARRRRWLYGPLALRGVIDLVLALVRSPVAGGAALAGYGVGTSTGTVAFQATVQTETPGEARGRVVAVFDVIWGAGRLVSLGLGGLLMLAAAVVGATGPVNPPAPAAGGTARSAG